MFRRFGTVLAALTALTLLLTVAYAQNATPRLEPEVLRPLERPGAVFDHDQHNTKAKITECARCHHDGKNGKIIPGQSSEGIPCSDCHAVEARKTTSLVNAYHQQCIRCHKTSGRGPTNCGGCHVPGGGR